MEIKAFPKIVALGGRHVESIFDGPVEITEKIDGSQFGFGWDEEGFLHCRSKNRIIYEEPDNNFKAAVDHAKTLPPMRGMAFYCEVLARPKHNNLEYGRTPKNNLVLFGISNFVRDVFYGTTDTGVSPTTDWFADILGIEPVPVLYRGLSSPEHAIGLIERESALGKAQIEGVVIKNYAKEMLYVEQYYPIMSAKYVSEKYKEVAGKNKNFAPKKDLWREFMETYRTEARWEKAVQHLRDNGELLWDPKDIGYLIKRIQEDIKQECQEDIAEWLVKTHMPDLLRRSIAGMPEWYKEKLALGEIGD